MRPRPTLLLAALLTLAPPVSAAPPDGVWEGRLQGAIRLRIRLATHESGRRATLDSPDQGATGLPLEIRHLGDDSLAVWLASAQGGWAGRLSEDGATLTGTWSQGAAAVPLTLRRLDAVPEDRRPQEPLPPFPYDVAEVTFENAAAGVTLSGTLTTPRGAARPAAVVLVSGSGPQDRDSAISGHRPFLVLADHLTRAGLAVLRYDDRGFGRSSGRFADATTDDFAADAAAAVAYLRALPGIDTARIMVIGHSEGGLVAARLAARDPRLAAVVSLAGPALRGDSLLAVQSRALMRAAGRDSAGQALTMRFNREVWRHGFEDTPDDTARARVERAARAFVATLPASDLESIGEPEAFIRTTAAQVVNPWFRSFVRFDPGPDLERVNVPMLACFGERDLQVPPDANVPALTRRFPGARAARLTVQRWPKLNHLFQTATTGLPAEYGLLAETLSPALLDSLTAWLTTAPVARP